MNDLYFKKVPIINTMKNKRIEAVKDALRQPNTWPGMYPKSFLSYDGVICHKCIRDNFRAVVNDCRTGGPWNVKVDVLWEGEFHCVDCGCEVESAYGPVEV